MLNPLAIQKQSLFPVGGENSGIGSLLNSAGPPTSIEQITPPSITPPSPQTDVVDLQRNMGPMQNPYGSPTMQNTSNVDDLNLMVDNIINKRLKEFFGGIMGMLDV